MMPLILMPLIWLLLAAIPAAPAEPAVVEAVDLSRYAGKWYEIARLPNRFQRNCTGEVTATYELRPDGAITVLNQCRGQDGKLKTARGTARLADPKGSKAKLKVRFFWPFSGDYWILGLDADYRWALVGGPKRNYLWILAREPRLDEQTYVQIVELAHRQGFDTTRLIRSE